jgi:hypothetical protein
MNRSTCTLAAVLMMASGLVAVAADTAKNLLKEPSQLSAWRLEQHEQGMGSMMSDGETIAFNVTTPGAEHWHVQAFLTASNWRKGKAYTFTYKAKGDPERSITADAGIDEEDWHGVGLREEIGLTTDWKEQTHTFKAENVAQGGKNRIGFILGAGKGKVWVKDLTLT